MTITAIRLVARTYEITATVVSADGLSIQADFTNGKVDVLDEFPIDGSLVELAEAFAAAQSRLGRIACGNRYPALTDGDNIEAIRIAYEIAQALVMEICVDGRWLVITSSSAQAAIEALDPKFSVFQLHFPADTT